MRFFIFIVCLFCGIISGILYDVLFVARVFLCGADKRVYTVKDRIFIIAADILYCLTFAAGYIFTSVTFDFEGFRLYMLIGCGLGALLYLKSFHVIVAFSVKKVYNKLNLYLEKKSGNRMRNTINWQIKQYGMRFTQMNYINFAKITSVYLWYPEILTWQK